MNFSVGLLYSSQELLKLIKANSGVSKNFGTIFSTFQVASADEVLKLAQNGKWIIFSPDGRAEITKDGLEVLNSPTPIESLRIQLKHLIWELQPTWAHLLIKGRFEASKGFSPEIQQCFNEAELFENLDDTTINWWDSLAATVRSKKQFENLQTGRKGERLSLKYEKLRTGLEPIWQCIESNHSGFDVLSKISKIDQQNLLIEVKASENPIKQATFVISRNEWNTAENNPNAYIFHLWCLNEPKGPVLFEAPKEAVEKHIPTDQGVGNWENVRIRFGPIVSQLKPVYLSS